MPTAFLFLLPLSSFQSSLNKLRVKWVLRQLHYILCCCFSFSFFPRQSLQAIKTLETLWHLLQRMLTGYRYPSSPLYPFLTMQMISVFGVFSCKLQNEIYKFVASPPQWSAHTHMSSEYPPSAAAPELPLYPAGFPCCAWYLFALVLGFFFIFLLNFSSFFLFLMTRICLWGEEGGRGGRALCILCSLSLSLPVSL